MSSFRIEASQNCGSKILTQPYPNVSQLLVVHDLVLIQQLLHLSLLGLQLELVSQALATGCHSLADVLQNQGLVAGHPETTLESSVPN